jgi:hypothetical protein
LLQRRWALNPLGSLSVRIFLDGMFPCALTSGVHADPTSEIQ